MNCNGSPHMSQRQALPEGKLIGSNQAYICSEPALSLQKLPQTWIYENITRRKTIPRNIKKKNKKKSVFENH